MKKLFRDFIRGAGYLSGYGDYPGTFILISVIFWGVVAGSMRGWWDNPVIGSSMMFVLFFPFYFIGCVRRARAYDATKPKKESKPWRRSLAI